MLPLSDYGGSVGRHGLPDGQRPTAGFHVHNRRRPLLRAPEQQGRCRDAGGRQCGAGRAPDTHYAHSERRKLAPTHAGAARGCSAGDGQMRDAGTTAGGARMLNSAG